MKPTCRVASALPLLFTTLLACTTSAPPGGAPVAAAANAAPKQACLDMADAVAKAAERCGYDYAANRKAFIGSAANGDCANILSIRDEDALRKTCIPSMATIPCPDLLNAKLDPTCLAQLQHK